jgi:hypothetical protein
MGIDLAGAAITDAQKAAASIVDQANKDITADINSLDGWTLTIELPPQLATIFGGNVVLTLRKPK